MTKLGSSRLRKIVFDDELGEDLSATEKRQILKLKKKLEANTSISSHFVEETGQSERKEGDYRIQSERKRRL